MRKIISILLALSMVLALSIIAAPASADVTGVTHSGPEVKLSNYCACEEAVYNITFNISASLTEGVHCICIKFPAGTTVPATGDEWEDGDIMIYTGAANLSVFGGEVTVSGTEVCFLPPAHIVAGDNPIKVVFTDDAEIANPCTPGWYRLEVKTCREPDSTYVKSALPGYKIIPCLATFGFLWDAGPSYAGIAEGFVPPYKACGQNVSYGPVDPVEFETDKWANAFNLTFGVLGSGCFAPCNDVDIYMQLTNSPQKPEGFPLSTVTLNISTPIVFNGTLQYDATKPGTVEPNKKIQIANDLVVSNLSIWHEWPGLIHFDTVGEYTICVWAECSGAGGVCEPPLEDEVMAEACFDISVKQSKDAAKVVLDEKWNLISLPLVPFDTDIDAMLASLDTFDYRLYIDSGFTFAVVNLYSIWYYDAAAQTWLVHGNGQSSLTTLEDGKAYWFRLRYPLFEDIYLGVSPPNDCGNYTWWVFGTEMPEPPNSPAVYSVVAGWNMVGFTSMSNVTPAKTYLWNWDAPTIPAPVIYGWKHGCFAVQQWTSIAFNGTLVSGQGYWMAFPFAGSVFQVVP